MLLYYSLCIVSHLLPNLIVASALIENFCMFLCQVIIQCWRAKTVKFFISLLACIYHDDWSVSILLYLSAKHALVLSFLLYFSHCYLHLFSLSFMHAEWVIVVETCASNVWAYIVSNWNVSIWGGSQSGNACALWGFLLRTEAESFAWIMLSDIVICW